jgi:rsbT co-antagonist protein RsbR
MTLHPPTTSQPETIAELQARIAALEAREAERAASEASLHARLERSERLLASMPGMVYQFVLAPDGAMAFPYVSEGCRAIYNLEPEDIRQDASLIITCVHADDQAGFQESVALSASSLTPWRWEGRICLPGAGERWVEGASRPEARPDGSIVWHGLVTDITERKRLDEMMRQQLIALESSLDGIALLDASGIYQYMNLAHATVHGFDHPDELIGQPWTIVVPEDQLPVYQQQHMPALYRDGSWRGEVISKRRDGTLHPTELTLTVMPNGGMVCVVRDVSELKLAEAERVRLQEEIIQAQDAALAELSTPMIPITEDILVLPLIGTVDSRRSQQVVDSLLRGIAENRARFALLDITGVPIVDTQVANALIRAAQAVQLLGAQVVLTGIRPEVAQMLVSLGVSLNGVVTRGTLQAGITYAMNAR